MEEIFGYVFRDGALLREALTTPACRMSSPEVRDNQRLEFLGDAVLGLLAAREVYEETADGREGDLTIARARMVSTASLRAAALRTGLQARLAVNKGATAVGLNPKALADAVEAVIGAAFLDGGLPAASAIYSKLRLGENRMRDETAANPKGALQAWAQALVPPVQPVYSTVAAEGPPHEPVFTVEATVPGRGSARARAGTRKEAEAAAAAALYARLAGGEHRSRQPCQ